MRAYRTKTTCLKGTNYREVSKKSFSFYQEIKKRSRRRPYTRSVYFRKEKIFLGLFWSHIYKKNYWDQIRRMKFFECAIELIQKNRFAPMSKENPNKSGEILHRFAGITRDNKLFFVQIKEDTRNNQKYLISIFPVEK